MKQVSETHSMYNVKLLPAGWSSRRMFTLGKLKKQVVGDHWAEFTLLSLTLQGVIPRDLENRMGKMPTSFDTYQIVEPDDLIFCLFDVEETPRTVGLATQEGIVTGAYTVMTPSRNVSPRFLYYQYLAFDQEKSLRYLYAGLRNTIRIQDFKNLRMAIPPLPVQEDIADFLDRETAEIDAFIADQERLIELLEERRAATITHAVTKGLDSMAPMKDSNIDWLGRAKIPETWRAWKMSHILRFQSGDSLTSQFIEEAGTYPVYGGGGFRGYTESFTNDGDHALIGRQGALCGNIRRATGKFFATEHAIVVYPLRELNTLWLTAILQTMDLGQYSQSAAQPGISVEVISQKKLPVPPLSEQNDIAKFLEDELTQVDAAVSDAREAIALSRERRAALISAAVTGQIDVSQAQSRSSAGEMLKEEVRV